MKQQPASFVSLCILSLLAGLIWRAELEWHGWAGLNWLTYFHYAIPVDFCIVLYWINGNLPSMTSGKRILFNLVVLLYSAIAWVLLTISIYYMLPGPAGMMVHLNSASWLTSVFIYMPYMVLITFPVGAYFILRLFKWKPTAGYVICSFVLFWLSFPVSIFLLDVLHHKGAANDIHAIKSGFIFPFMVLALGLLVNGISTKLFRP